MNTQTLLTIDGITVNKPILLEAGVAIVFDFLDKPTTKPVNSHNWVEVFYYDNLFIISFDADEKREEYKKAYENITWAPNWFVPRIGNFFERNNKYYFVWDYDDAKLADITDATKTNDIFYRWVVISPVIFWQENMVKNKVNKWLSK